MSAAAADPTSKRILDVAQRLVQSRGFSAFSYADIADELEIRKASIHHHFPSKGDLGRRLMERYHAAFSGRLAEIEASGRGSAGWLLAYVRLFAEVLRDDDRMCLCGMLAADFKTLPRPIRESVRRFFDFNEEWLARILETGRRDRSLRFDGSPRSHARTLFSGLEGAMLVARTYGEVSRFQDAAACLLASVGVRGEI